jgi:hypothetical protein
LKTFALITLSSFLLSGGGASGSREKQDNNSQAKLAVIEKETPVSGEPNVLAEGFHSSITNSFMAVIRDAETYRALGKLDGSLPSLDEKFFKANIVIAAFLGERNTGGYRVDISSEPGGYRVAEKKPGRVMMVPQMITAPFKMVSVSATDDAIKISLDDAWEKRLRHYRVTSGTFTMSGGFAGRVEEFPLNGGVNVMREGKLPTFAFVLLDASREQGLTRALIGFATGMVHDDEKVVIPKLSARSLVDPPNGGLQASGAFSAGGKKLSLMFTSLPSMIADGYSGGGSIEAELAEPVSKP